MSTSTRTLRQLPIGESAEVLDILAKDTMKRRFQDLGLINGTHVRCIAESAFHDISIYSIRGANIAIRDTDADTILLKQGGAKHERK